MGSFTYFRRMMAAALVFAMIGGCMGIHCKKTTSVKAATNDIYEDFETDSRIGIPMGDAKFKTTTKAYGGKRALYVSNRDQDWYSYSYDVSAYQSRELRFHAYMRVDEANLNGIVCVKTIEDGKDNYTWIACTPLKKGKYTKVAASYQMPECSSATLYFGTCYTKDNSKQTKTSFYLDNVSIKMSMSIHEDFNNVGNVNDLRGQKIGKPKLMIMNQGKGDKALKVTNRKESYYGYLYDLAAFAGNKISVKAKISAVGGKKNAKNTFIATLKTSDDNYKWVATVKTKGNQPGILKCASYQVPANADKYFLYFEGTKGVSYVIDDIEIKVVGNYVDPASVIHYADTRSYMKLKNLYQPYFKLGVGCETISHFNDELSEIGNPAKEALIKQQFNSMTFGNELKPEYNMGFQSKKATETNLPFVIDPSAKEILDWCKKNKIMVRGHVLVWHNQCPDEIFCKGYKAVKSNGETLDKSSLASRNIMLHRLKSYIYSTMEYMYKNGYADIIYAWDVVNEAIEMGDNEYNLRETYWYQTIGPDFIYYAFKYSKDAVNTYSKKYATKYHVNADNVNQLKKIQPKLFYNEFNEFQEDKCDAIIRLATDDFAGHNLKKEGLIDGIGMQGHVKANTDIASYMAAVKKCSDAVGEVQLTEFDVAQTTTGVNAEYYQMQYYKDFFQALIQTIKEGAKVTSVTIWGLTDDGTWKDNAYPLLFKADLSKKLAFDGMVSAVNNMTLPGPAYEAPDFKDLNADFEQKGITADQLGLTPRGAGTLSVQEGVVYGGKAALLDSGRTEPWNGISFDVTRFIGQTIEISAWIKTAAPEAKLSADIDGTWPNLVTVDTSDGTWKKIQTRYKVPADMTSLSLYFEATTTDDIYLDDVKVKLIGLEEGFEDSVSIVRGLDGGKNTGASQISSAESHNETGHSYLIKQKSSNSSVKFDISKYIGYTVKVDAYVKTSNHEVNMTADSINPRQITTVKCDGEWTKISAVYHLSNQMTEAFLYLTAGLSADLYVDDINVTIDEYVEDCETADALNILIPRWGGAGKLSVTEDAASGKHAVVMKERTRASVGTAFDVSSYIGMKVQISMDVKSDDSKILLIGDITDVWPTYLKVNSKPGQYQTVTAVIQLPSDVQTLKLFVRTNGTSDLYMDNLKIRRVE